MGGQNKKLRAAVGIGWPPARLSQIIFPFSISFGISYYSNKQIQRRSLTTFDETLYFVEVYLDFPVMLVERFNMELCTNLKILMEVHEIFKENYICEILNAHILKSPHNENIKARTDDATSSFVSDNKTNKGPPVLSSFCSLSSNFYCRAIVQVLIKQRPTTAAGTFGHSHKI